MIAPQIPLVKDGQILSVGLVNSLIGRTEYAADLLRQYKLIAGYGMYVEPHSDGTRVSYLQPVAGGATPRKPINRFPGFPSATNFRYNARVLIEKYKPGSAPTDPAKLEEYFQPFIDGFRIDVSALIEIYGPDAYLKGSVFGGGEIDGYFANFSTILVVYGQNQYLTLRFIPNDFTLKLVSYYFGKPPFVPPKDFYPTSVSFEVVNSIT